MSNSARDTTISHFHTDPIFINQVGVSTSLSIGQIVYLDIDGNYKPAISTGLQSSYIQGIVWSFSGTDAFYLKTSIGPIYYRFPLTPNFYMKDIHGNVLPDSPNSSFIPGSVGVKLYLSSTIPGGLTATADGTYPTMIGYKTETGFIFHPKTAIPCCIE